MDQPGGATRPNVIAITNAYPGCLGNPAGHTPTVKFALRLSYGVPTSATLSLDGNVLFVIESRPAEKGGVVLHAINVHNITKRAGTYDFRYRKWTSVHTLARPDGNGGVRNTLLIRIPYNGSAMGSPAGFAALHRDGDAASVPTSPVEFLTGAAVPNPDSLFVGGNGDSYLFLNRIAAGFGGSRRDRHAWKGSSKRPAVCRPA